MASSGCFMWPQISSTDHLLPTVNCVCCDNVPAFTPPMSLSGTDALLHGRIALLLPGREDSYRILIQCIFLLG
jgi:hypothetical protein